jgi:hypothetical protein|tara:strand:- start:1731 stop:1925 length:195 start_codon:yes stop_codon:yes gene_type:complete
MESLWIKIGEEFVLVNLSISEETVNIEGADYHTIEFNSGFRKLVSVEGVSKMQRASEKVDGVLG